MVSPYPPSKAIKNVREVVVPAGAIENYIVNVFANKVTGTMEIMKKSITICSDSFASENVQALLKEEFDVALIGIFMADCYLSLIYQLQVKYNSTGVL